MTLTAVFKLLHFLMILGRCHAMYKQTMSVAKGVGMGTPAGAAVAALSTKAMNGSHRKAAHMKKNASKAIHTVGNIIGDMEKILK